MTPDNNYVYEKGTLFVAPGGGGAPTPLAPGAANQALFADPTAPLGVDWGAGSAMGDVVGPVSSTAHHLAAFADTSGVLLEDSGVLASTVALGAGSSTAGDVATFANTDGKTLADSGVKGTNIMQVIRGTPVDMTAAATTTLFTPAAPFVVLAIMAYAVTITGSVTNATYNIGTNSSTFDNYVSAQVNALVATHDVSQVFSASEFVSPVIPAATPIKIDVTGADSTASVDSQRFDIIGYYV